MFSSPLSDRGAGDRDRSFLRRRGGGGHAKDSNDDRAAKGAPVKSVDDTTAHFISN